MSYSFNITKLGLYYKKFKTPDKDQTGLLSSENSKSLL